MISKNDVFTIRTLIAFNQMIEQNGLHVPILTFWLVLQAILSLTDPSNCVSGSSIFDTAFLPHCTKFCSNFHFIG